MASLDSLPADQKAVLSLVLQRGRSFDQIATLLSVDRAAVRERALQAFDALGPESSVDPLQRGLITDYLLGQLPPTVAGRVHDSLAVNPPERAWARVVAAELAPLAAKPLPEIPAATATAAAAEPATGAPAEPATVADAADFDDEEDFFESADTEPLPRAAPVRGAGAAPTPAAKDRAVAASAFGEPAGDTGASAPPSSRRGGAILLGLIGLVVVIVVVVLLVTGGSSKSSKQTQTSARAPVTPTTAATTASTTSTGSSTSVTPLHQINLISPNATKGREGAADVVRASGKLGIVIVAEGLAANAKNAYGVWLYDTKSGNGKFLGFYSQQVTSTGKTKGELEAEDALPADATSYNELLLTLESTEKPTKPGTIVLQGTFAE